MKIGYPSAIPGIMYNNINADISGYYNAGTFWHKYLNDKDVTYDLMNVTTNETRRIY